MQFILADTFAVSLSDLTHPEQKQTKLTVYDLQAAAAGAARTGNPDLGGGLRFHTLKRAADPDYASVSVNKDLRIILARKKMKGRESLVLCHVGHHDEAYAWAERRALTRNVRTGAMQFVEIRETVERRVRVEEVVRRRETPAPPARAVAPLLPDFARVPEGELLNYGVPPEWVPAVGRVSDEDALLELCDRLPAEAAEALLTLAAGETPAPAPGSPAPGSPAPAGGVAGGDEPGDAADPFAHPDSRRRFRVVGEGAAELRAALEQPWDRWMVFLHPAQRSLVDRTHNGPARVAGSAGTGKTVVALHRTAHLARRLRDEGPDRKVLLTTFSEPLADDLRARLDGLLAGEPAVRARVDVKPLPAVAADLHADWFEAPDLVPDDELDGWIAEIAARRSRRGGSPLPVNLLRSEWRAVIDPWRLTDRETYLATPRTGQRTRLGAKQRGAIWEVAERVFARLEETGRTTEAGLLGRTAAEAAERGSPYAYCVADEAQDLGVPHLRLLAALAGPASPNSRADGSFFAGDLGQRIFQAPFSWKALGVDVRGRSSTLRVNYRTSHQIRAAADKLLPAELADVDGVAEGRRGAISAFHGGEPEVRRFDSREEERDAVAAWLRARIDDGVPPAGLGLLVRGEPQRPRAEAASIAAGFDPHGDPTVGATARPAAGRPLIVTMHRAKGLEFRAAAVIACDDDVLPDPARLAAAADPAAQREAYDAERRLLYVACTRARDALLVAGVAPASEFLDDFET